MDNLKEDFASLVAKTPISDGVDRRGFLKTALGSGFAAAVLPIAAHSAVATDSKGLTVGEVTVNVNGQAVPVYRAQPAGKTNLPVVLVISEIFGVHEYIADVARRFAKLGYLALAPELFVRQGDPGSYGTIAELQKEIISKVPDAQVMTDLDAVVAWAKANGGNTDKLGITGFCWGGRVTWLYSAHNPKVKAGVAWYGRLVGNNNELTPKNPVDIAGKLKTPVLGLYGAQDGGIPVTTVVQMQDALSKGGSKSEFVLFKNSGHAFHADYRASYVEADAKEGWQRCIDWFKTHGVS
ncbi:MULTISPECIES: dienelactone hydrolase family protein [Oxalobacteraceae]|uniref:dienelactone hydrolase family protein n=1 Tax=Herminiimonas sp. Marseille-P9896 TaxID=2742211 RepID=UPI00158A1C07|nr:MULTISPECIES: dienelactone hydrolase family protein [Oxalobacteraceae]